MTPGSLSLQLIIATVAIPVCLALMLVGDGLRNVGWAKKRPPFFCVDFTDGVFLSGRQAGLLGVACTVLGLVLLLVSGLLWLL